MTTTKIGGELADNEAARVLAPPRMVSDLEWNLDREIAKSEGK